MTALKRIWRAVVEVVWGSKAAAKDARQLDAETQRAGARGATSTWNAQ